MLFKYEKINNTTTMKYSIIFDFKTFVDTNKDDLNKVLYHLPNKDINYNIDGKWYSVEDIDYLMDDDTFVISLIAWYGYFKAV